MWGEFGRRIPFGKGFFLEAFDRGVCGWECIIIRQESCSTIESGNIRE
jgi:hypothetical protein